MVGYTLLVIKIRGFKFKIIIKSQADFKISITKIITHPNSLKLKAYSYKHLKRNID